ncbi:MULTISPECIES: lipoyl(octanoyl) transferase LipB [unclassified Imperialibacter]|uniref:lipoyl(octanoyl) transferase LipB n=1 Tax=unclassified Imperialibacter TaxID=2629706 RepID=UPI0012558F93|nr:MULTISPECIES: lipoyl(octanoyl) transferase LipB [unclassified Imperialibacter]CAD5291100.1 Octanoyltransferase [Imperialibacter sp. 89]CAD5291323.1 Octanoyltransferase [Imperialibacter sp. 75]VVT34394.1 Octanoyltransferase [Imperialibacter sp. EC-SDR9]
MQATAAIKNKTTQVISLGFIDYQEAWDYQEKLFAETVTLKIQNRDAAVDLQKHTPNYLLFCQHPHVFTLGKSGKAENLLVNDDELKQIDANYYKINRGGDITYHGPGQLVVYPIVDLDNFFTDIHKYLRLLEEAVIMTLAEYGVKAGRIAGLTGVWLDFEEQKDPRKICALGVKSSRWVTMHGLAFNVNTNLDYFKHIVPCGIDDKAVTSLQQELGIEVSMEEVQQRLLKNIASLFEMNLVTA